MFRVLLPTLFFITFYQFAIGQYLVGPKISLGALRMAEGKNSAYDSGPSKVRETYAIGGVLNFDVSKHYSLNTELNFSKKTRSVNDFQGSKITYNHIHVDLPVMLRLSANAYNYAFGYYKYFFNIGPEISYWMAGSGNIKVATDDSTYTIKFKEKFQGVSDGSKTLVIQDANRLQFGLNFGAGLSVPANKNQIIVVELRYHLGQTYLGDEIRADIAGYNLRDNFYGGYRSLTLSVNYLFKTGIVPSKKGKSTIKPK